MSTYSSGNICAFLKTVEALIWLVSEAVDSWLSRKLTVLGTNLVVPFSLLVVPDPVSLRQQRTWWRLCPRRRDLQRM